MASVHPKKPKKKDDTNQILLVGFLHSSEFWNIVELYALPNFNIWKAINSVQNPVFYPNRNPCTEILYTAFNSIGGVYSKMQRKVNLSQWFPEAWYVKYWKQRFVCELIVDFEKINAAWDVVLSFHIVPGAWGGGINELLDCKKKNIQISWQDHACNKSRDTFEIVLVDLEMLRDWLRFAYQLSFFCKFKRCHPYTFLVGPLMNKAIDAARLFEVHEIGWKFSIAENIIELSLNNCRIHVKKAQAMVSRDLRFDTTINVFIAIIELLESGKMPEDYHDHEKANVMKKMWDWLNDDIMYKAALKYKWCKISSPCPSSTDPDIEDCWRDFSDKRQTCKPLFEAFCKARKLSQRSWEYAQWLSICKCWRNPRKTEFPNIDGVGPYDARYLGLVCEELLGVVENIATMYTQLVPPDASV